MCRIRVLSSLVLFILLVSQCSSLKIDDSVHFNFKFDYDSEITLSKTEFDDKEGLEQIHVRSRNKEDFVCYIPTINEKNEEILRDYTGPSPIELLAPLYHENVCSVRGEGYWSYEVCHGRYILQFHEEKVANSRNEYYLGNMNLEKSHVEIDFKNPPKIRLENNEIPYFPVKYTQGTTCEVTEKPRTATILYVCNEYVRSQIYSINEVSTCAYEVVILTRLICKHPLFKPLSKSIHDIVCYNTENKDDPRPLALADLEKHHADTFKREYSIPQGTKERNHKADTIQQVAERIYQKQEIKEPIRASHSTLESWHVFISGEHCLESGGNAYWKYKICFGSSVTQFHAEPQAERIEIVLGEFDYEIHRVWVDQDKENRKPRRSGKDIIQINYMYGKGEICQETGAHRNVIVRIRCHSGASPVLKFSIEEPETCSYILDIEHASLCEPMQYADEYGIIPTDPTGQLLEF